MVRNFLPFDIWEMSESKYSNKDKIETAIQKFQLVDSGMDRQLILQLELHLASIYTVRIFLNDGNRI